MKKNLIKLSLSIAAAVALTMGCGDDGEATTAPPATEPGNAQRVAVTVTDSGYEPAEVQAAAGEPLTLVFTRTSDQGCGHEVAIPSAGIERELPLNEPVEVTFTPESAGELRFTCGMDMYDGKIVVR